MKTVIQNLLYFSDRNKVHLVPTKSFVYFHKYVIKFGHLGPAFCLKSVFVEHRHFRSYRIDDPVSVCKMEYVFADR